MALLTVSKFNFYMWLIMPMFIVCLSIPIARIISKWIFLSDVFEWIGTLSGLIFIVHPIVRDILISRTNQTGNYYGMLLVYLSLTMFLSWILKPMFSNK